MITPKCAYVHVRGLFWTRKGIGELLREDGNVPYLGTGGGNMGTHLKVHQVGAPGWLS